MTASNLWACLFACTVFFLGIDSAFSLLEATLTVIQDSNKFELSREAISLMTCSFGALCSILFCFNWGFTLFDVIDHYLCIYLLTLVGVLECFSVAWLYRFDQTIQEIDGRAIKILAFGFWTSLLVLGLVICFSSINLWNVILIFWLVQIGLAVTSFKEAEQPFNEWFNRVCLYGVREMSR
jgi:SNF family Na+-dependent transporter